MAVSNSAVRFQGVTVNTIKAGDGKTFPKHGDELTLHYTGKLAGDGTIFDSSKQKDAPISFRLGYGEVIR
eukprot:SAG31_NODE_2743_length_5152_cov_2.442905_3_plen_70_part_00